YWRGELSVATTACANARGRWPTRPFTKGGYGSSRARACGSASLVTRYPMTAVERRVVQPQGSCTGSRDGSGPAEADRRPCLPALTFRKAAVSLSLRRLTDP